MQVLATLHADSDPDTQVLDFVLILKIELRWCGNLTDLRVLIQSRPLPVACACV
jgi:hypothetical protein